ncbi:MAG: hypothetical protein J7M40_00050 [Planctomycetes bacterium]|nr:hypothetical protein [Planctomycetota bacterium]
MKWTKACSRKLGLVVFLTILGVAIILFLGFRLLVPSPEDAYKRFLTNTDLAEDQSTDPLILGGKQVIPLVLEGIGSADMPRRRYAIAFLGDQSIHEAIPLLRAILEDPSELEYFRGDALEAIMNINSELGIRLAQGKIDTDGHLGFVAQRIMNGERSGRPRRTFWDALIRRHD